MAKKIRLSNVIAWQVVPSRKFAYVTNLKTRQYFQFEDTAMVMWMFIAEKEVVDRDCVVEKVAIHYKVDRNVVEEDIDEFLGTLHDEGLIEYGE